MKTIYIKKSSDQLSRDYIAKLQKLAKDQGYDEVAFYYLAKSFPYLTIGVDEAGDIKL